MTLYLRQPRPCLPRDILPIPPSPSSFAGDAGIMLPPIGLAPGHWGDTCRKACCLHALMVTDDAVGILPTYQQVGVLAPFCYLAPVQICRCRRNLRCCSMIWSMPHKAGGPRSLPVGSGWSDLRRSFPAAGVRVLKHSTAGAGGYLLSFVAIVAYIIRRDEPAFAKEGQIPRAPCQAVLSLEIRSYRLYVADERHPGCRYYFGAIWVQPAYGWLERCLPVDLSRNVLRVRYPVHRQTDRPANLYHRQRLSPGLCVRLALRVSITEPAIFRC